MVQTKFFLDLLVESEIQPHIRNICSIAIRASVVMFY